MQFVARVGVLLAGFLTYRLHAERIPYRDVIRVFELADRAGFRAPALVPARAVGAYRP